MTWLLESPWPSIMGGIVAELLLAIAFFQFGKRSILISMGAVAALVIALVLLERTVTTQSEEVEQALATLAATLATNDVPAVLDLVGPEAKLVRSAAERHMPRYKINSVNISRDLKITVDPKADPPTAVAKFTCRVNANDRKGQLPYENAYLQFAINFRKDGDRWLVAGYDVDQPEIKMGK